MKKHRKNRPAPYRAAPAHYGQRFRGSFFTVLCNFGLLLVYGTSLMLSVDGAFALILFSIMASFQLVICTVIGFNYNSRMWLISALVIFLIGCGVVLYSSM